ncbi:hypothetical protein Bcav_1413 [Beutenbergia cavernae DSM 12333]|uniref:Aldose 1-epimerase n=1 Tax=Beutenbergia cavernae (strain ATCC BAA-8 / DSM 12333 / CCUG 43141 / JCM 11478 / NBRC 16432 / NCIMB 13614 / HKI 0122) TaxID=471853 RepID=C5C2I5_BEUC1|nr:aldose 1-epimerase [Beutenbergia cavernae]ACQ79671.1 hypothetical protein Bcav_1413 [Beutenbergia cavernae DSM 12333]
MGHDAHPDAGRPVLGTVDQSDLTRGWTGLVLRTAHAEVTLLPEQGCDVYAFVDRRTGVDVLWKTPWAMPPRGSGRWNAEDEPEWLERYPGGWQVLLPNGGAASRLPGDVTWGFHGEASRIPWEVVATGDDGGTGGPAVADDDGARLPHDAAPWAELTTRLTRSPLRLHRRVDLRGTTLGITESVTNTGPDPIEVMWSHHPAFGAPLIAEGTTIEAGARTVVADAREPGTDLVPGSRHDWPLARTRTGADVDLSVIPAAPRATLAYLTDLTGDAATVTIANAELDLGVTLRWDPTTFPHAWLWQELHAHPGAPWWREAYVCAVEPASTIPGHGIAHARDVGAPLHRIDAGATSTTRIEAVLVQPSVES